MEEIMNRRKTRETLVHLYYSYLIQGETAKVLIENFKDSREGEDGLKEIDFKYIELVLTGLIEKCEELKEYIKINLTSNWTIERIPKLNLAILSVGIYEIKFLEEIPKAVAINEAVNITKKFSDMNTTSFVNSVLDKIN